MGLLEVLLQRSIDASENLLIDSSGGAVPPLAPRIEAAQRSALPAVVSAL